MKVLPLLLAIFGCSSFELVESHDTAKRGLGLDLQLPKTCEEYVNCCSLMPKIKALKDEANQLGQKVSQCEARIQEALDDLNSKTGQDGNRKKRDSRSLLTVILNFPSEFSSSVDEVPFEFDLNVELSLEFLTDLLGWLFISPAEKEECKTCCKTMKQLPDFLAYVQGLRNASATCEQHLNVLQAYVDEILSTPVVCPSGFNYSDVSRRCYAVSTAGMTYDDGRDLCRSLGGTLVSIRNQNEQAVVEDLIESVSDWSECNCGGFGMPYPCYTTSGQTRDPLAQCGSGRDGTYVWKPTIDTELPISYTNWSPVEPNCDAGSCVVVDTYPYDEVRYQWTEYSCSTKPSCPICEAEAKRNL